MTPLPVRDTLVGAFVLAGLLALAYLSIPVGGLTLGGNQGVLVFASFDEIGGLKARAQVVVGGVRVGTVESVALADDFRARVALRVRPDVELPDDSSASILTSGVLGDQYVAIEPGGSESYLSDGGEIPYTQSAIVLERLLGKFIQNFGGNGSQ